MSEKNYEARIAALESLVTDLAKSLKQFAAIDTLLIERISEAGASNVLTVRLLLEAGVIQSDSIRQRLTDAMARVESMQDQSAARVREILARLNLPGSDGNSG